MAAERPRLSFLSGTLGALALVLAVVAVLLAVIAHRQRERLQAAELEARDLDQSLRKHATELEQLRIRFAAERGSRHEELEALGKELEAAQDEAMKLRQDLRKAKSELEVVRAQPSTGQQSSATAFERGLGLLRAQNWREAYRAFSEAFEADQRPGYSLYYRGICRQRLRDSDGALEDFNAALVKNPALYKVRYNRGSLRLQSGDSKGALADAEAMLEVDPKYAAAYYLKGLALSGLERRADAIEALQEAVARMAPEDPLRKTAVGALRSLRAR